MELLARCIVNMYCKEKCEFKEVCSYHPNKLASVDGYCNISKFIEWLSENNYSIERLMKFSE